MVDDIWQPCQRQLAMTGNLIDALAVKVKPFSSVLAQERAEQDKSRERDACLSFCAAFCDCYIYAKSLLTCLFRKICWHFVSQWADVSHPPSLGNADTTIISPWLAHVVEWSVKWQLGDVKRAVFTTWRHNKKQMGAATNWICHHNGGRLTKRNKDLKI